MSYQRLIFRYTRASLDLYKIFTPSASSVNALENGETIAPAAVHYYYLI
jgi:hypothetical protein